MISAIALFGVMIYKDINNSNHTQPEVNVDLQAKDVAATPQDDLDFQEDDNVNKDLGPFNQPYQQGELTDQQFRDYIHKMSHQKVIADNKWGFYKITDERLTWLLEALDHEDVKSRLTDGDIYLDILQMRKNKLI